MKISKSELRKLIKECIIESKVGEEQYNQENDDNEREWYKGADKDNKKKAKEKEKIEKEKKEKEAANSNNSDSGDENNSSYKSEDEEQYDSWDEVATIKKSELKELVKECILEKN